MAETPEVILSPTSFSFTRSLHSINFWDTSRLFSSLELEIFLCILLFIYRALIKASVDVKKQVCHNRTNSSLCFFQNVKINKWDGAAAKNAIDDAIREVTII